MTPKVALIMGSDSDFEKLKSCVAKLKEFKIEVDVNVISAHRTPAEAKEFTENAEANGFGVIIAAAGMAAHLAGAIAANTVLPVIGIPVKNDTLSGMDALLSTVQMPTGIPVATVAINGAGNAALLSVRILALTDKELSDKLKEDRAKNREKILAKNADVTAKYSSL